MGDHENGSAVPRFAFQPFRDQAHILPVKAAGGLVQDQYPAAGKDGAGNGKPLLLPAEGQAKIVELNYKDYLLNGETQTYAFAAHAQAVNKNAPDGKIGGVASGSNGTTLTGSWNGVWATNKVVDLTEFNSLVFDVTVNSMTGWGGFAGVFDATGYWGDSQIAAINGNNLQNGENVIDVSGITGLHRVGIAWYGSLNLTVHAIYRR